ncbi:efflux RND transporter periplasmic adaptor subunit [Jannaschia donghaensis]|uniref:Multidrug resistance protein MexA n=1 Tax=Jannaschia donghaensis TaxID=420998 RepID=A0A0M6YHJ1_9RHOB|nr:efflux RND transporter periplasmic adaptor subunit [Jannaschia donghaensis]CTQ48536.1 Multidrug resistance protein MexA precursor [Jannaschia donghaensis]
MPDTTSAAPDTPRESLQFPEDRGASRATWIAGGVTLVIVAWMASGFILPSDTEDAAPQDAEIAPVSVAIQSSQARTVTLTFQAEGQAQPDRDTAIRAETSGDVAEVLVSKGDDVAAGSIIARLSTTRVDADLRRAQADLDQAQREFDNATQLLERGVATADRVAQARAALTTAQAQVTSAEDALDASVIVAPFDGRIETLSLDEGEFVQAGTEVGRIVDNRPLTVAIQVPQQALNRIRGGQTAEVSFITGEEETGEVSFVGTAAASETRTFLVEIEVPNSDGAIPAGISAEIRIPTGETTAHFISPSIISLAPSGQIGVKTVVDDRVSFLPVEVVRAEIDGVWVSGLPEQADLITIGQGFVRDGETVAVRPAATGNATGLPQESLE